MVFTVSILTIGSYYELQTKSYEDNPIFIDNLRTSENGISLNYSNIWQNGSSAYRIFDNIKFDINASNFLGANATIMQVEIDDETIREYQMEWVSGTNNFTFTYTPEYDVPLGFHNISFIIMDDSKVQLNSQATKTNITILSNYVTHLNGYEYERNETVYGELSIDNFGMYNFGWKATLVDNDTESESFYSNIFDLGNNLSYFAFKIDDRLAIPDHEYYVKVNISDSLHNKIAATYIPFKVKNSIPRIIESSVEFSHETLKREEECQINLNVSDADPLTTPENITVTLKVINSQGEELSPIVLDNNGDWTFSGTLEISKTQPLGIYQVQLEADDKYEGDDVYSRTLIIENNFPEIHDYWINGFSTQDQVSIKYGDEISFTFNTTDIEDNYPAYITISLLDENNEWYNITRRYRDSLEIIIRTEELITGVWYVYISATDSDGDTTQLLSDFGAGPKEIRIIPDELSGVVSWFALFVGLGFGILLGIAISYKTIKSRMLLPQKTVEKKKKTSIKKVKKEVPKKKPEEEKEEETTTKTEEPEHKVSEPQRKIKRRLS